MTRILPPLVRMVLGLVGLLCWLVMFLAGTDAWHDLGSPNIWRLSGPPYEDLRAVLFAFYVLFILLTVHLAVTAVTVVRARRPRAAR